MLYAWLRVLLRIFYRIYFRLEPIGLHNIPETGPVILCSNHKSNWDPPTVAVSLQRNVRFMAKAELFGVPIFGSLIRKLGAYPVKRGGISKESVKLTLQLLEQGQVLLIFPEGTRKNTSGIGKRGAATFAMKANAVIVPVAVAGDYKPFRKMKVVYGEPIQFEENGKATPEQLEEATEEIMRRIRALEQSAAS